MVLRPPVFRRLFSARVHRPHAPIQALDEPSLSTWLFYAAPVALTFSLGVWQVKRLSRKKSLIQQRHHNLHSPPLNAADLSASPNPSHDFRLVSLQGRLLHQHEMLVAPRSAPKNTPPAVLQWGGSSGLHVITPCQLDDGRVLLVNRGWIPQRLSRPAKRLSPAVSPLPFLSNQPPLQSHPDAIHQLKGVIRLQQECNRFTPNNVPANNDWFFIDPAQMLDASNVLKDNQLPVVVELIEPVPQQGWPFPRDLLQFLEFQTPPSTHVTYATTWFSLSAVLALLARSRLRRPVRHRAQQT